MDALRHIATDERRARVALALASEPGSRITSFMVEEHGAAGAANWAEDMADGTRSGGRQLEQWARDTMSGFDPELISEVLEDLEGDEVHLLIPGDAGWPERLDGKLAVAPLALWVAGDPGRLQHDPVRPEVALLGSTKPSLPGTIMATQLAADLVADGYRVTTPGGAGIGGAAVDGVTAAGGQPLMVLPGRSTPLRPYRNDPTAEEAAASGVVIAELAIDSAYAVDAHASRNRVLLPLVDGVVLVDADERDPDVGTVRDAVGYGIATGAVPPRPGSAAGAGCERILEEGRSVRVNGAGDLDEMLEDMDDYIGLSRSRLGPHMLPGEPPAR